MPLIAPALAARATPSTSPTAPSAHPQQARAGRQARWPAWSALAALAAIATLAGCSSTPPRPPDASTSMRPPRPAPSAPADSPAVADRAPPAATSADQRDGPGANPPPDLLATPDAQPRVEAVRSGGANKPYEALGQAYTPLSGDPPLIQRGLASWYGRKFHGRSTANGETYNMYAMTAAHKTMPLPSYARVRNPANGREVVVRVNDRGPFHPGRVIDLSYTAALKLGTLAGVAPVEIERITYDAIRAGTWRTPANLASMAEPGAQPPTQAPTPTPAQPATPAPTPSTAQALAPWPASAAAPLAVAQPAPALAEPASPPPTQAPTQAPAQAAARAARGFWLQLGAFAQRDGAMGFQQQVAREAGWLAPLLTIFTEQSLHRLQAGPYASRNDARQAADRLREALKLVPALVERR